jgi:hypothetical protein
VGLGHTSEVIVVSKSPFELVAIVITLDVAQGFSGTIHVVWEHSLMVNVALAEKFVPVSLVAVPTITLTGSATIVGAGGGTTLWKLAVLVSSCRLECESS